VTRIDLNVPREVGTVRVRDFLTISGGVYCALAITLKGSGSRVIF
jgi:hypothetical protein